MILSEIRDGIACSPLYRCDGLNSRSRGNSSSPQYSGSLDLKVVIRAKRGQSKTYT